MPLGQRKQAEMKPTPRSARMGAIADALMAARDWADKAKVPEAVPLVGGQGLGSLVLGKAPEELTEISYGNMPVRINPLAGRTASYVPEIKPGRKEQVADLAMLAGTPKVGKAGLGLAGGVSDVERAAIAYHGTPHRFEPTPANPLGEFRAAKIGSGEGAQAYGYGLYFAESPGVAREYQKMGEMVFRYNGKPLKEGSIEEEAAQYLWGQQGNKSAALEDAFGNPKLQAAIRRIDPSKIERGGSLYTVDIPDEMVEKMLDWDKSLKDQPSNVKKALEPLAKQLADGRNARRVALNKQNPERTTHPIVGKLANREVKADDIKGNELYEFATQLNKKPEPKPSWTSVSTDTDTRAWSGQQATSAYLRDLGIPGIRYFDRQSRDVKEGTRNIVVFPGEESKVKILKRDGDETKMAKGGMMARNIPGFQEGGANVDPVSGNDVPVGSMPEEVRDDIDAKLSPGEFVLPADVVRFIGLERLMKMRDEAKKGLQRMSEIGQMGNADEVGEESNSTYEDEGFESEIDDILEEIEAEENVNEQTEVMMAQGGFMKSGTDLTKAPKNPVFDVRYYKNDEGSVMYITHINGKPMTPIPEGYKAVTQEEAQKVGKKAEEAAKATQASQQQQQESSYEFAPGDPGTFEEQSARNQKLNDFLTKTLPTAAKVMIPGMGLVTLAQKAAGLFADQTRPTPAPVTDVLVRTPAQIAAGTTAGAGSMIEAAAADAYSKATDGGLSDTFAGIAAESAAAQVAQGVDPAKAVEDAVRAAAMDAYTIDTSRGPGQTTTPSSGSSFAVSPPSVADTSPVSSRDGASRDINDFDPGKDRSSSYDYGGSSYSGGFGTGTDFGEQDYGSFLAKGGLVNKRQYPAKKKRGKGLASAKP